MGRDGGQGSVEYVAVVALVALVLAAAVALTSGGLGEHVVWAWRTAACRVAGGPCPGAFVARADLPPCPLFDDTREQSGSVSLAVVHVGRSHGRQIISFSDGHVEVSFSDGGLAGFTAGLGGKFRAGPVRVAADTTAGVDWGVTAGKTWTFPDPDAADAFVARYGHRQELLGGVVHELHSACFFCTWVGAGPARLPPADTTTSGHGTAVKLEAELAAGWGVEASADLSHQVLGAKRNRDGSGSVYLEQSDSAAAAAQIAGGASGQVGRSDAIEIEHDAHGRPTAIVTHGLTRRAVGVAGASGLLGRSRQDGTVTERATTLAAPTATDVRGALVLVRLRPPTGTSAADLVAFLSDLRRRGISHRRTYALHVTRGEAEAEVAAGLKAGADLQAGDTQLRLLDESTRVPGLPSLPRADCRPAGAEAGA